MTLERYFKINGKKNIIDFSLRAQVTNGVVTFYIHPDSEDGETLDFYVFGNDLISKFEMDQAKEKCLPGLIKLVEKIAETKKAQKQLNGK
jgi:hypothetical protein